MKDYYNILGIKKNATFYDITEAYRELSIQYHPDNHPENEEYVEKYNDIQEAYKILSNGIKRQEYDNSLIHLEKTRKENQVNAVPSVEYFRTDKPEFEFGDEVTFMWKTHNADNVTLVPFGKVQPVGSHTEKIKNYKNKLLTYELIAENTVNGRESKASVSLQNKNFEEIYNHFKKEVVIESKPTTIIPEESLPKETKPKEKEYINIEKDHRAYMPGNKEDVKKDPIVSKPVQPKEKVIEPKPNPVSNKPKDQNAETSDSNFLLYFVIMVLIAGIAALIYLGFFM